MVRLPPLLLALALFFCLGAPMAASGLSAPVAYPLPPDETLSDWAIVSVNTAIDAGIVPAQLQSHYQNTITRIEFCALAVTFFEAVTGAEITARAQLRDTDDINAQKLAGLGVVLGTGDGNLSPERPLTRAQAAALLSRLAEAADCPLPDMEPTFSDRATIPAWAHDAVGQMEHSGIMVGGGDNAFSPDNRYTREQSIITILRLYDYIG